MKNFFAFLLLGLAAAFVSCGDENTENQNKWFLTPQAAVSGTTVEVSCLTRFGDGVLDNIGAGFAYAAISGSDMGNFVDAPNSTIDGSRMSATLSGLAAKTTYLVYAYADLPTGRVQSAPAVFETGQEGDTPAPDPEKPAFGTPSAANVGQTTATLNCALTFDRDAADYTAYFRYKTSSTSYERVTVTSGTGAKTASLSGLTPGTAYEFQLCVDWDGKTFTSASASFTTDEQGVTPPPAGDTKYAGWAELPGEVNKSGDYYYAYHMRADAKKIRNFSVCYSKKYGCPVWVAAPMHSSYKGGSGRSSYSQDPDLGCSQVTKRTGYTRGHMLGSSDRTISSSTNKQVFYYSNIAPQLESGFNQGQGVWNNLEQYVDGQWCADTLYQVIGSYWKNTNTTSSGTVIPTHYYKALLRTKKGNSGKWVVNCSRDELKCVVFMVEHNSSQKYTQPNKSMMISVKELEEKTGFRFFTNVPNAPKDTYNASDWGL